MIKSSLLGLRRLLTAICCVLPLTIAPFAGAQNPADHAILLVASPELRDPNFAQTVVLVLFPEDGGPLGVILNRQTRVTLAEAFADEPQLRQRPDKVYFGGPVRINALMFLFRSADRPRNALPVLDDLYFSGDGSLLDEVLARKKGSVERFFVGCSGWAPTQLDAEIAQGGWYVLPADLDTILKAEPKTMWRLLLGRATAVKT
jgi:putative transcriptional regulator